MSSLGDAAYAATADRAATQWGLFTTRDAERAGADAMMLRRWQRRGAIIRRAQGLYRIAGVPVDPTLDPLRAAWLTIAARHGGDTNAVVISHLSAAVAHGLLPAAPGEPVDVSVNRPHRTRSTCIALHHAPPLTADAVTAINGLPVTSISRTVADLRHAGLPADRLDSIARAAVELGRSPGPSIVANSSSPVIVHVPHAGTHIPPVVRRDLLLDDHDLAAELEEATDWATDRIARGAASRALSAPSLVLNPFSRLVIDPERFPDADPADQVGRGAVYTRTCRGLPLRAPSTEHRQALLAEYFTPHAAAMHELVTAALTEHGHAVVLDLHSYPLTPARFEKPAASRPQVCLGTDDFHTPPALTAAARELFSDAGYSVEINTPYAGCYIPLEHYRADRRVTGLMVEIRRDVYRPGGELESPAVDRLGKLVAELVTMAATPP